MKKFLLTSLVLFATNFSVSIFAQTQEEVEAALQRYKEQQFKKQQLIDAQHGSHYGVSFSTTALVNMSGGAKTGIHFFYGNRLGEHWMLGGLAGAEFLSPKTLTYYDNTAREEKTVNRPYFYVPIMGEVRFYLGTSRFMPFLFTDIGAGISKYSAGIFNTGIGADINFKDSHTIFINLGLGTSPISSISDRLGLGYAEDQTLKGDSSFAVNFRLGYYF